MAIIRKQDIIKMNQQERESKMKELEFELVKAQVTAHKATAKTKEIKRTLARLITLNTSNIQQEGTKR